MDPNDYPTTSICPATGLIADDRPLAVNVVITEIEGEPAERAVTAA